MPCPCFYQCPMIAVPSWCCPFLIVQTQTIFFSSYLIITINVATAPTLPGIIMRVGSTNERCYIIKLSRVGWAHTQNDSCVQDAFMFISYLQLDFLYYKTAFLYQNGLHLCVISKWAPLMCCCMVHYPLCIILVTTIPAVSVPPGWYSDPHHHDQLHMCTMWHCVTWSLYPTYLALWTH